MEEVFRKLDDGYHIILLSPQKVKDRWESLFHYIRQSLPPGTEDSEILKGNLLLGVEKGTTHVWIGVEVKEDIQHLCGILVTVISIEPLSETKVMVIYSLTSVSSILPSLWLKGFEVLKQFAKSNGINSIIAYTTNEQLAMLAKKLGAVIHYTVEVK